MKELLIKKLIEVGKLLYVEDLVDARAGNLSCRLEKSLIITRRGSHLGRLREEDFIKIPLFERHMLEDRASSELLVHREVYMNTNHVCVVHAHPISAVILSFTHDVIEPVDSEGKDLLGSVKVLPPYPSGSEELARSVSETLKDSKLVIVRSHGVFSANKDPFYAYAHISVLERSCKILLHGRGKL